MSDSESEENLSDLEENQAANGSESNGEEAEKPDLKGILDDVEETEISWKDLVKSSKARVILD
jgi:hypothetical protein